MDTRSTTSLCNMPVQGDSCGASSDLRRCGCRHDGSLSQRKEAIHVQHQPVSTSGNHCVRFHGVSVVSQMALWKFRYGPNLGTVRGHYQLCRSSGGYEQVANWHLHPGQVHEAIGMANRTHM